MYSFPKFETVYCSMSGSNCCFSTCIQVSQEAGKVVWYSHLLKNFPQFVVIHTKSLAIVNEAKVDVFLEFPCFFYDPMNVGNLVSGSSAFSKSILNIWKCNVLLKPGLENFEHYFASVWDECNCTVVWAFFTLPFSGIGVKTDLFQSCGHCSAFQICWHIECSTFTTSSFQIWNSSTWIPSPPLALFIVMFPKAHLTLKGCCWITRIHWDSWAPEEKNSIRGQRRGLIAQSFCVIKFY